MGSTSARRSAVPDTVDGGAGINDQIGLEGDYTGANALVLQAGTIANVEVIGLLAGFDYDLTMHDGNVPAGGKLDVFAGQLGAGDNFTFDGSAETDGSFKVFCGLGTDLITTGAGNDGIYFGPASSTRSPTGSTAAAGPTTSSRSTATTSAHPRRHGDPEHRRDHAAQGNRPATSPITT